jgi:dTDP-D-glucose 4,6-dehydratase
MLEYDIKYLKCLFDGLIDSDGYYGKSFIVYSTISEKLVSNICELGFKLGKFPRFDYSYSENIYKDRKICGYGYKIFFPERNQWLVPKNQAKENYKGKIWCLTVEDNKNFIVERNGKLAFCGNTDEVYGPASLEDNIIKEDGYNLVLKPTYKEWDRYNCTNPYSASKGGAEQLVLSFMNTYRIPGFIVNCMNVFGERQHPEKYIPICIRKILHGEMVTIHGTPDRQKSGSRFYIHARNVASAVHFLLDKFEQREKYNIVGEKELTNLELAQLIAKSIGKPLYYEIVDFHSSRPGHDLRYALDGSKMEKLGWKVPLTIDESLDNVVKWTIENDKWM